MTTGLVTVSPEKMIKGMPVMRNNSDHAMFADATHDEQSAQSFIKTLRVFSTRNFHGGNEAILKEKVLSKYADGECPPRREMRIALEDEPHNRWWSSLMRTTQEMLYDTVGPSIERQLPDLIERAKSLRGKLGSLTLDDSVDVPPYLSSVDMHCKPGSYHQQMIDDDVFALDDMGFTLTAWLRDHFGEIGPKRILDIGCTVGHSTLPYCDLYPDAEIHAIDVAATCLRYGHARAVAMEKEVHFSQQNAEHTNFEDGSFDLIVSHAVLHETSRRAIRAVFKECHRLLAPGGLMIHMDGITPNKPFDKYYSDWMSINNNEPYLGTVQDEDFVGICTQAGFSKENVTLGDAEPQFIGKASDDKPVSSYLVVSAQK